MRRFSTTTLVMILILTGLLFPAAGRLYADSGAAAIAAPARTYHAANDLLIRFKPGIYLINPQNLSQSSGNAKLDSLNANYHLKKVIPLYQKLKTGNDESHDSPIYLFRFDRDENLSAVTKSYARLKIVDRVEYNYHYFVDPASVAHYSSLDQLQIKSAIAQLHPQQSVIIGIIDTGIDWENERLKSNLWRNDAEKPDGKDNDGNGLVDDLWGWNFVDPDLMNRSGSKWESLPVDYAGHGTRIAGIITDICNYDQSLKKNQAKYQLMILKAGARSQQDEVIITAFSAAQAIFYAVDHGARVINLPWGGEFNSLVLESAVQYAVDSGCAVIAPAGDENRNSPRYPAALKDVWAVAATDSRDEKIEDSNYGYWVDITAPGLWQTNFFFSDSTGLLPSGTAVAAARVTGLAALLLSSEDIVASDSLKRRILWSSENIYDRNFSFSGQLGAGRINFLRAITAQHRPNIIIQKINCNPGHNIDSYLAQNIIPLAVSIKNLSSLAHNIRLKVTADDPYLDILTGEITISHLGYLEEFSNRSTPFMIALKEDYPPDHKAKLIITIETSNGFTLSQQFDYSTQKILPRELTLAGQNPVKLVWKQNDQFVGYNIYRKNQFEQSYSRVNDAPISDLSFLDISVVPGDRYSYYITGIDSSGWESAPSNLIDVDLSDSSHLLFSPPRDSTRSKLTINSVTPESDTTLQAGDSLAFLILFENIEIDSLEVQWRVNKRLMGKNNSRFVLYADSLSDGENQVEAIISSADTSFQYQWQVMVRKPGFNFDQLIFSPASDTSIRAGDSLQFRVLSDFEGMSFLWAINEQTDSVQNNNSYWLHTSADSSGMATVSVKIGFGDSTRVHQWYVNFDLISLSLDTISFFPSGDTTIYEGDSLNLVVRFPSENDSLTVFYWQVNGRIDSSAKGLNFPIKPDYFSAGVDTVVLKYATGDTTGYQRWLITILNQNRAPEIVSTSIPIDSTISPADTLLFSIFALDPDGDSLRFLWSLNGKQDTTSHDSVYIYQNLDSMLTNDTLSVRIADADTSVELVWILWAESFATEPAAKSINWFPKQDSLATEADSLILWVQNAADSCRFEWSVNGKVDSIAADSIFVYHIASDSVASDTIQVKVMAGDSTLVHQWYFYQLNPPTGHDPLRFNFQPDRDQIITSLEDSLKLSAQIVSGDTTNLEFQWLINSQLDSTARDSIFYYQANDLIATTDTIVVVASGADTTVSHRWIVQLIQRQELPAPQLIFPVEQNEISEVDYLTWENDSALVAIDSSGTWEYLVQLSRDSTFSSIISADSCRETSIALKELSGFDLIEIDQPLYWRVKIFSGYENSSAFTKSARPFSYYPQFAELESFTAQKQENQGIDLAWTIRYPKKCAGFNVYRSESRDDNYIKINDNMIYGETNFSYQDNTALAGKTYYYKLENISINGNKKFHYSISVTAPKPDKFSLWQNYPNPFNTKTSIKYELPVATQVKIIVSNVLGRKVKTLVDEHQEAGFYTVYWDGVDDLGENVVSGIYFYTMATSVGKNTRKMIVVR